MGRVPHTFPVWLCRSVVLCFGVFVFGYMMAEQDAVKPSHGTHSFDQEEYTLRKRLPRKYPKRKNDVYINRRTDFKAQHARCMKLLESGYNEIYIHGLGAAVNRAINLALQIQKSGMGTLDLAVNTSTVELVDDFEPERDELEHQTRTRHNSAVHICLFRRQQTVTEPSKPAARS